MPAFNAAGAYTSGATGSDAKTAQTALSAIDITVQENSPEGELLRGAHDHQTVYTLHLENNQVAATGPLTVETFLPAGLEFLGCGQDDNTTDAATNPGSQEEWQGAGPLDGQIGAPANCDTPAEVATVVTDPDGAGPLPNAVYTRVRWTNVPTLAAGGTRNIRYVAAVPLRANTTTWTGATPSAASLQQGSNLDNNAGARTQDEQALPTHATAAGNFNGVTPSSDADTLTRTAEDIRILKDASQPTIADGQLTRWMLTLDTGEYRYVDDIRVTDTVPDGLCPLASPPLNADADCAFASGNAPSAPYDSATENANGSWTLVWDQTTDPALARMQPSAHHVIQFSTRSRSHYQENGNDQDPVLARDTWTNAVSLLGADYQRCIAPADCGALGTKIDTAPGLPAETDLDGTDDVDESAESQAATAPTIDKTIRTAGGATPVSCGSATYTDGPTGPYGPGDRVCYRLRVDLPGQLDTGTPTVTDFLPPGTEFESYTPTGANTVTIQAFDGVAGDQVVNWTLGDGSGDATNGQVFEVLVAARVDDPTAGASNDVKGNLMKFSYADPDAVPGSLSVSKTADDRDVRLGRPVGTTISVRNESSRPATGVVAVDDPSAPVEVVSAVPQQGRCDERSLRCELGTIPAGGTVTIRVVMIPRRTGALTNSVTAFSDQGEAQASDNLDLAGVTVRAGRASFKLGKRAARKAVKAGGRIAYTIRARNTGPNAAADVRVCDVPRTGLTFARIRGARLSRGRACWTVAYWKPGQTRTFRLVARVNGDRAGTTHNVAVLRADNARKRRSTATVRAFGAGARGGGVTG